MKKVILFALLQLISKENLLTTYEISVSLPLPSRVFLWVFFVTTC